MNTCIACLDNCEACSNFYDCDKCREGTVFDEKTHSCAKCPDGTYLKEETFLSDEHTCVNICEAPKVFQDGRCIIVEPEVNSEQARNSLLNSQDEEVN